MHKNAIYSTVIARFEQRRGSLRVFDRLISERTAHVVVDLQNGFVAAGAVAEIAEARAIVPNVNRISRALRSAGGPVVYIQNTLRGYGAHMVHLFDHCCTPDRRQRMIDAFMLGADGHFGLASMSGLKT